MSVTIDSLQIEIQSSSSNAAAGIDALATSLGKLKQNSSLGVAVKNLNNLSDALKKMTTVTSNANKISALADAMMKLKSVGSTGSGVKKLAESLQALKTVDYSALSRVASSSALFEKIAASLGTLSAVKPGGLGTMVNALAKIGDVTEKLDDAAITKFASRVTKLSSVLEPLSMKMTTIQAGLRGMNGALNSANMGTKVFNSGIKVTTFNLANMVTVIQGVVAALMPIVRMLAYAIGEAMEWDGISYQFGNAFGDQADKYYAEITKLTEALSINKQTFMENSAMATSMLIGFGVGAKDAREMGIGYTELAYDIWAAYNNIYKTFDGADGAMAAVRSAISGEVESIRRAGFTIVESQLEMTAANYGIAYSSEKATEAQKSYLRYLTLVDQAHSKGIVGAYAHELNTAEGLTRTLTQQMKSLAQTFGSLFLPILVKVMPWLQAFVELMTEAIVAIASFFGIEIQPVSWGDGISSGVSGLEGIGDAADEATDSLGDTAGAVGSTAKALEDLKKATIGIDELNVISPPHKNSGSGGSAADNINSALDAFENLDVDSLWDEAIFDQIQSQVDDIKKRLEDWLPVIGVIAAAFAGWKLAHLLTDIDDVAKKLGNLTPIVKNLATGLAITAVTLLVGKMVWDFTGAYLESENIADLGKALGTTVLGAAVGAWLAGPLGAGIVIAVSGIVSLTRLGIELSEGSVEITDPQALITAVVGTIESVLGGALVIDALRGGVWLKSIGSAIGGGLKAAIAGIDWMGLAGTLAGWLGTAAGSVVGFVGSISAGAWAAIAALVAVLTLAIVDYDFTDVGRAVGEFLGGACRWICDSLSFIGDIGKAFLDAISGAIDWVIENITLENILELLGNLFDPAFWTETVWPWMCEVGTNIVNGLWQGISDGWNNFWGNITEFCDGFVQGFKDAFGIHSPSTVFAEFGGFMVDGLWKGLSDGLGGLLENIGTWCGDIWDSIVGFFGGGNKKTENIDVEVGLVKKSWTSVKEWIGNIPAVSQAVTLAKSGWSTVKNWIGNIPGVSQAVSLAKSGWSSIKSWLGGVPAVSQVVKLTKSGWSSVKSWIGSMPTLSAGIKLVKSGWTTVKKWLGSLNFDIGFKLPKIGINWGSKEVLGFKISYPKSFYTYAKGGFPDIGELFVAREAGPEMVGRIGSKTTVANNQQIVEAVSAGVYSAVLAAMKAGGGEGGTQSVNVYLDGRQIASSVEQHKRERGASLMGNQVYAY